LLYNTFLKEEVKTESRKKNLIILILNWLTEEGYVRIEQNLLNFYQLNLFKRYAEAARSLEKETNLDLRKFDICDNIDLDTILQEYESYYYVRFSKYPKITKKVTNASKTTIFKPFKNI
jgi:katanin p60 ATPase-containing subunit A1